MRRAARVDANQAEIVAALRKMGVSVQSIAAIGRGCTDILWGWAGVNGVMEIKNGSKPPSARKKTPAQIKWHADWRGYVDTVTSVQEAITVVFERTR